jgi:hypothetical protein
MLHHMVTILVCYCGHFESKMAAKYDHFCVFHYFSILAISMSTAAILKKSTLKGTTSHGI